jgi:hypothetical protein
MNKILALGLLGLFSVTGAKADVLRYNQIGYLTDDVKVAVYLGDTPVENINFKVYCNGKAIRPDSVVTTNPWEPFSSSARVYFTSVTNPGTYNIVGKDKKGKEVVSGKIYVGDDAYSRYSMRELPLNYLREQRCGDNPAFEQLCHQHDGVLVLSGDRDGEHVDVRGGWHDASDFLQYLTTSANTVYQLLFGYKMNPEGWADQYDASGRIGANGIPDVLDEARHGLEWMLLMNPEPGMYLNQIADDRDHLYAALPAGDDVDYGFGKGLDRPVYPCSGKPYGLKGNINDSKGLASSVAKFASSFGLGAELFKDIDPAFANLLAERSAAAYPIAAANPGACQTAPCISPYYYEEDNWSDDMQLAAMVRYKATGEKKYLLDAVDYGRLEPVTPWMGADSAHHYQWYPFINLGHYELALNPNKKISDEFKRNMRSGLRRVAERGASNAFLYGVPFIWCSNNLAVAYVTQGMLYRDLTGDNTFKEVETAVRDWIFGTNPWGQVMIMMPVEIEGISSPRDPHSTIIDITSINGKPGRAWLNGGLVDGPVYANIFKTLQGVHLRNPNGDPYAAFQNSTVVYHDDYSDYSTNEPTMDGTASLTYMLSRLSR